MAQLDNRITRPDGSPFLGSLYREAMAALGLSDEWVVALGTTRRHRRDCDKMGHHWSQVAIPLDKVQDFRPCAYCAPGLVGR